MATTIKDKKIQRDRRHRRVRALIIGTAERPRIAVSRSNKHIYAQVIDDTAGKTLAGINDAKIKVSPAKTSEQATAKVRFAYAVGEKLAVALKELGITKAVFDRGGFKYHGRVKAVAEALRNNGIKI
ncbi:MAG: 50S ribosomal protein L18 [Candidatus Yanofskybacteria bacterium]|nr:50S ribosomal protein L18 [Candidatus Yanofskybacteria bacterium]